MRRYVILRHEPATDVGPPLHWDLMLDTGTVLRTWSLPQLPAVGNSIPAVQLPDHRRVYLDYEGPVSRNRGVVTRHAAGCYVLLDDRPDYLAVRLVSPGQTLLLQLTRDADMPQQWTARFTAT